MTARVLSLIRHGRSDFGSTDFRRSPRGRQWDPPLDTSGRAQADQLAARLAATTPPAAIYCSPFRRCRETIEPYARAAGLGITLDEDIGEVFVGEWEGKSFEEIVSGDEELARIFRDQEARFALSPGGETGEQLKARVRTGIERMLDAHDDGDVMVVAHGGVINAYLGVVLGIDQDMFFLPDNASINTVVVDGDHRRVRFLGDVRHISEPWIFRRPVPP